MRVTEVGEEGVDAREDNSGGEVDSDRARSEPRPERAQAESDSEGFGAPEKVGVCWDPGTSWSLAAGSVEAPAPALRTAAVRPSGP